LTPTTIRCFDSTSAWVAEGRLGDLALLEVLLDRRDHAAELLDP